MNRSHKNDPRFWKKWARAGAIVMTNAVVTKAGRGMRLVQFLKPITVKDGMASMEQAGYRCGIVKELFDNFGPFSNVPRINYEGGEIKLDFASSSPWDSASRFLFFRT